MKQESRSAFFNIPVCMGMAVACLLMGSCGIHTEYSDGSLYSSQMYRMAIHNKSDSFVPYALLKVWESECGPPVDVCLSVLDMKEAIGVEYRLKSEKEVLEKLVDGRERGFLFLDPEARAMVRRRYDSSDLAKATSRYEKWSYIRLGRELAEDCKKNSPAMCYATAHYLLRRGFNCAYGPWIGNVAIQEPLD